MERGVVALFGETTMLASDSLKQFVNAYNIPFFTWSYPNLKTNDFVDFKTEPDLNEQATVSDQINDESDTTPNKPVINSDAISDEDNYLFNMHPSLTPLLISLMKYHKWSSVYYIYDSDEALNRLQVLYDYQMKEKDFVTNIHGKLKF